MAAATGQGELGNVLLAIVVMIVMVVGVNVLFWRPLTAWAERFRVEESEAAEAPRSVVLTLLRRSRVPRALGRGVGPLVHPIDRAMAVFGLAEHPLRTSLVRRRAEDTAFAAAVLALVGWGLFRAVGYIATTVGFAEVGHALLLGLVTFGRVIVLVVVATLVWVPVGVWIGLNPRVSRLAQPVASPPQVAPGTPPSSPRSSPTARPRSPRPVSAPTSRRPPAPGTARRFSSGWPS